MRINSKKSSFSKNIEKLVLKNPNFFSRSKVVTGNWFSYFTSTLSTENEKPTEDEKLTMRPEPSTTRMTSRVTSRTSTKTRMTSQPSSVTSKTEVSTDGINLQPMTTALAIRKEKK